ncbi:hypothetical protein [Sphingomonas sp. CFBP 13720]|uniref:hypothetical protein n=1 Tax=Sphingomonas sp. CFBP 13720 TaxID=2775302 RepID=UPI0017847AD5|nr:hypothetical protein [Sphingomonas sp. CFBP 13720]MBD8678184.1 hypothetical protein [Sphingomonas sp. CFBP 13720]
MSPRLPLVGALVAVLLSIPAARALDALARARVDHAKARATVMAGMPGPVAIAGAFPADDAADARARLAARLRGDAARGGVLIESLVSDPAAPATLAVLTLRASGPEKAVVAFVDALERSPRPVRMAQWRMTPTPGGVRIDARVIAPWRG